MGRRLKRISGITPAIDAWFDQITTAVEQMLGLTVTPPLQMKWAGDLPVLSLPIGQTRRFRLTASGGSGSYTGKEVFEAASGGWTDMPSGITPTLREYNGNASLTVGSTTGLVVEATYIPATDEWRFQLGSC